MNDLQVILNALSKEREQLHQQLMQIDRIIKRFKDGQIIDSDQPQQIDIEPRKLPVKPVVSLPPKGDNVKVLVLRVMDIIGKACKLKDIQTEYNNISGNKYNIREPLRSLQRQGLIKLVKEKTSDRGIFWIKSSWVNENRLMEDYKPEGFDVLYDDNNLLFE